MTALPYLDSGLQLWVVVAGGQCTVIFDVAQLNRQALWQILPGRNEAGIFYNIENIYMVPKHICLQRATTATQNLPYWKVKKNVV